METDIVKLLAALAKKHGLKKAQVARALRVDPATLSRVDSRIERRLKKSRWWPERLSALIALGIPADDELLDRLRAVVQEPESAKQSAPNTQLFDIVALPNDLAFGDLLRKARQRLHLTQVALRQIVNRQPGMKDQIPLSASILSQWEHSRCSPEQESVPRLIILARVLEIDIEQLRATLPFLTFPDDDEVFRALVREPKPASELAEIIRRTATWVETQSPQPSTTAILEFLSKLFAP